MTSPNGGQRFDDVIQVELEFLSGMPRRPTECSFDPTDQPSYVPKRAIAARRSPNTLKHNMITKTAHFFMDNECYPRRSPPFSSDESRVPGRRRLVPLRCGGQTRCWSVALGSVGVGGGGPVCGMGPTRRAESCQGDAATCADVVMIQEMIQ